VEVLSCKGLPDFDLWLPFKQEWETKRSHASNGGLIKSKQTIEGLIVIDCFSSMGLHLKDFKAIRVQEVPQ